MQFVVHYHIVLAHSTGIINRLRAFTLGNVGTFNSYVKHFYHQLFKCVQENDHCNRKNKISGINVNVTCSDNIS